MTSPETQPEDHPLVPQLEAKMREVFERPALRDDPVLQAWMMRRARQLLPMLQLQREYGHQMDALEQVAPPAGRNAAQETQALEKARQLNHEARARLTLHLAQFRDDAIAELTAMPEAVERYRTAFLVPQDPDVTHPEACTRLLGSVIRQVADTLEGTSFVPSLQPVKSFAERLRTQQKAMLTLSP